MLLDESSAATSIAKSEAIAVAVDEALVTRIERIVRCRTGGRIRDLRIDVAEDNVVISGIATTYYAKQLATHAALEACEQFSLVNDIEVS